MRTLSLLVLLAGCSTTLDAAQPTEDGRQHGTSRPAASGQFEHQVSLQDASGEHRCGGSVLDAYAGWVLTSAHCLETFDTDGLQVESGNVTLGAGVRLSVAEIHRHPAYVPGQPHHDLALVRADGDIYGGFGASVGTGDLADFLYTSGQKLVFSGWNPGTGLQYSELELLGTDTCAASFGTEGLEADGDAGYRGHLDCAGFAPTCGVPGGPVAVEVDGYWTLVGVATGCDAETGARSFTTLADEWAWLQDLGVEPTLQPLGEEEEVVLEDYRIDLELDPGMGAHMSVIYQSTLDTFGCTDLSFDDDFFGRVPEQIRETITPVCEDIDGLVSCSFAFPDALGDSCESEVRHVYLEPTDATGDMLAWASLSFTLDTDLVDDEVQVVACSSDTGVMACGNDLLHHGPSGRANVALTLGH